MKAKWDLHPPRYVTSILARTLDLHQGSFSNAWTRDPLATGWASLLLERWNLDRSADFLRTRLARWSRPHTAGCSRPSTLLVQFRPGVGRCTDRDIVRKGAL